jgi:hypothetical protein
MLSRGIGLFACLASLTHEVLAYAASLVHKGCRPLEDILQSGTWTSNQVFVNHYLRDLAEQHERLSRLGPILARRKVMHT